MAVKRINSALRSTPKTFKVFKVKVLIWPSPGHDRRQFASQRNKAVDVQNLAVSKKAQVFSLITLLMSALFILLFGTLASSGTASQADIAQAQTQLIESFMGNLDFYIGTTIAQSSYPILNYTVYHLNDSGTLGSYSDYETVFEDCLLYGQYTDTSMPPQTNIEVCDFYGNNNSLSYTINELLTIVAATYDASIDHNVIDVFINQSDAYDFTINVTVWVSLTRRGIVWEQITEVSKEISILGVHNPETLGTTHAQTIKYHPGRLLTRSTNLNGNLSLIQDYVDYEYYFRDTKSTSFTDRMEGVRVGNLTYFNPVGIVSFIQAVDYKDNETPHLDFLFTSDANFTCEALARIDDTVDPDATIDDDIILPLSYLVNELGLNDTALLDVCDCCDASGCDDLCG